MAPQLKKITLFSALMVLVLIVVHFFVQNLLRLCPQGNIAKVNAVMLHQIDAELTIWGASTARVQLDPQIIQDGLNLSCFNVGLDGTPFAQYAGLLEEYIDYSEKSKLLILAIDINGFGRRDALYQGYAWLHYLNNDHIYNSIKNIDKDIAWKSRNVPMYYLTAYDRRFLIRCFKWVYVGPDTAPEMQNLGFHTNDTPWDTKGRRSYNKQFEVEIEKVVVDDMKRVASAANRKNMLVAVVVPPCYVDALRNMKNRSEFERALKSLENENVKVLNYLDNPLAKDRSKFTNNTHLRPAGAALFSKILAEDIRTWIGK